MEIGNHVRFVDEDHQEHNALVTAVHGNPNDNPTINLLYVSSDESQYDQYGRQIIRKSSVPHQSRTTANGYLWK